MKKYTRFLLLFVAMGLFFTNCSNDDNIVPEVEPETENPETEDPKTAADYPVQDFMWQTMNTYYFWQDEVPNLADDKFVSLESSEYVDFIASEENPAIFFEDKLRFSEDRFSFFSDNYVELTQSLAGISKSNGLEFGLSLFGENREVFGYVEYIIANSNAATKDIKRGDIFTTVDGVQLYFVDANDNNLDLLDKETYTLGMADIVDRTIVPNNREVSLTKQEGLSENPILITKVFEQNGLKIGYLMYNSFLAAYDDQLNEVFGEFKNQNISELILDFRYNPGGRVSSAVQISSAIYGAETEDIFLQPRYNSKLQEDNGTPENFTDKTIESETPLNILGLNRVYVITSNATASASELVINGLEPYIDVVQVGTTTTGKSEFSLTFVDDPEAGNVYRPEREQFINPDNQWAIQPLLGKNENADGFSGYEAGLVPDHMLEEDIADLGVLGQEDEPLLALTLSVISGTTAKTHLEPVFPVDYISNSKMFKPLKDNMFMDGLIKPSALTPPRK